MNARKYTREDLLDNIGDALFYAERRHIKAPANIVKLPAEPPQNGTRGLFRCTESAIWYGLQSYLHTSAHSVGNGAQNMAFALLHHPELTIKVSNEFGTVVGKIKRETDRWNQPVVRMYRAH